MCEFIQQYILETKYSFAIVGVCSDLVDSGLWSAKDSGDSVDIDIELQKCDERWRESERMY